MRLEIARIDELQSPRSSVRHRPQRPSKGPQRFATPESTAGKNQRAEKRIFMKLAITRFVIVAAIAVLMVAVGSTAAWA
ncbi:MAG: hypothetical protein WA627_02120, partial [Candidatus Sulfotelmatobacter sp.]